MLEKCKEKSSEKRGEGKYIPSSRVNIEGSKTLLFKKLWILLSGRGKGEGFHNTPGIRNTRGLHVRERGNKGMTTCICIMQKRGLVARKGKF